MLFFSFFSLDSDTVIVYLHHNNQQMTEDIFGIDALTTELKAKEILSAYEAGMLRTLEPQWAAEYLFHNFWDNTYLNLAVYSEADHEAYQLKMEQGI